MRSIETQMRGKEGNEESSEFLGVFINVVFKLGAIYV
jgi:hypothetical protein